MMNRHTSTFLIALSVCGLVGTSLPAAAHQTGSEDPMERIRMPPLDTHCGPQTIGAEVGYEKALDTVNGMVWDLEEYGAMGDFNFLRTETITGTKYWLYEIRAGFSRTADYCDDEGHLLVQQTLLDSTGSF